MVDCLRWPLRKATVIVVYWLAVKIFHFKIVLRIGKFEKAIGVKL